VTALLARARALAASPWALPALLALGGLVLTCGLDAGRRAEARAAAAEAELRRHAEARELEAHGLLVAERARTADLERSAREMLAGRDALAAELARVRAAAPGGRVGATLEGSTGSVTAGGAPRPADAPVSESGGTVSPPGAREDVERSSPPAASASLAPGFPQPNVCVLAAGDRGELRLAGVVWETKAGNLVPVLEAEAWRVEPAPATRLLGGLLRPDLSRLQVAAPSAPEREAGWGAGVLAWAGQGGWAVGPAVALPPARLWRLQLEVLAGAAAGPTGTWGAGGSAVIRWR
jgi:hypothetical protein